MASLLNAVSICLYFFSICFSFRLGRLWRTASCLNLSCRVLADMNSCEDLKTNTHNYFSGKLENITNTYSCYASDALAINVDIWPDLFFSCWIDRYRSGIMLISLSTSLGRSRRRYQVKHWDFLWTKYILFLQQLPKKVYWEDIALNNLSDKVPFVAPV